MNTADPPPQAWPEDPDGDHGALLDDSMIAQIEAQVPAMAQQQTEIDETERKHLEAETGGSKAQRRGGTETAGDSNENVGRGSRTRRRKTRCWNSRMLCRFKAQAAVEERRLFLKTRKPRRMENPRKKPSEIKQSDNASAESTEPGTAAIHSHKTGRPGRNN